MSTKINFITCLKSTLTAASSKRLALAPPEALVVSLVEEKAKRKGALQVPEILGGPGRTRTCNQTVMSGGISIGLNDFAAVLFDSGRACYVSFRPFLMRNWCGVSGD